MTDEPIAELRIVRGGVEARCTITAEQAELELSAPDGATTTRALPHARVPVALAQMVGLEPRARPAGGERRMGAAELAAAISRPDEQTVLETPLAHWRVERPPRALEILDTGDGLFMVGADGEDAVLSPTTPARAFRGLVRLADPRRAGR
jgi:hypothetical protein